MRAGEYPPDERRAIDVAIRAAETATRFEFSVYSGPTEPDHRDYVERMHAVMASPHRSVLIMINVEDRALEIITGRDVRRLLPDEAVEQVAMRMKQHLAAQDLTTAIVTGLELLAESACQPQELRAAS